MAFKVFHSWIGDFRDFPHIKQSPTSLVLNFFQLNNAVQRGFQNPLEYLKIELFAQIVYGFQPLTYFCKKVLLDVWQGSE